MYSLKSLIPKCFSSVIKKKAEVYIAKSTDIVFNLCTEEFFYEYRSIDKPVLFLYQNEKNVNIGKHQNPWKECDIQLLEQDNLKFARRRTGGGATYHDMGNMCFAFLLPYDPIIDFRKINYDIIINSFKSLNIPIEFAGRNDLLCDGRKISGSSFKINLRNKLYAPKSFHHGTMLVNVDMKNLQKYLHPHRLKLISKGIDSVQARVINLNEKYPWLTVPMIYDAIEKEFLRFHGVGEGEYDRAYFEDETSNKEEKLMELYNYSNSWDWKFGETLEFTNSLAHKFDWGLIDLSLRVDKGKIQDVVVYSDSLHLEFIDNVNKTLKELGKGKFAYNPNGIIRLLEVMKELNEEISESEIYSKFVDDMKEVLVKQV